MNEAAGRNVDAEFDMMLEKYKLGPKDAYPHIQSSSMKISICVRKRPIFAKEESNGEIDANRLEVELKDFKARQLWDVMMQISDDASAVSLYGELLREVVIGGIDFRDLSANSNTSRCPRLDWWQCFIDYVNSSGGIRLGTSKRESSLRKTVTWIKTQVETSLAMLRDVLGAEQFHGFVRDAIDSGRLRYDRHHLAMLQLHTYGYDKLEIIK